MDRGVTAAKFAGQRRDEDGDKRNQRMKCEDVVLDLYKRRHSRVGQHEVGSR